MPSSLPFNAGSTLPTARAAPVVVGMIDSAAGHVVHALVVGVRVDGRHEAALDAEGLVKHLGHRGKAVRRAARVRHHHVAGFQRVFVDAHHDNRVDRILRGHGQKHLPGARFNVHHALFFLAEHAGGFQHQRHAAFFPGQFGRVLDRRDFDFLTVDDDRILRALDVARVHTVDGVVFQQMGKRLRVGQVVDRLYVEVLVFHEQLEHVAANPPESVDAYLNCHGAFLSFVAKLAIVRLHGAVPRYSLFQTDTGIGQWLLCMQMGASAGKGVPWDTPHAPPPGLQTDPGACRSDISPDIQAGTMPQLRNLSQMTTRKWTDRGPVQAAARNSGASVGPVTWRAIRPGRLFEPASPACGAIRWHRSAQPRRAPRPGRCGRCRTR